MKTKILPVLIVLLLQATTAKSQDAETSSRAVFKVYSVNISSSWYQPKMDYWNDAYLPLSGVSEEFGGNFSVGGQITFALPADFRTRIGVSYWSDEVKGNEGSTISSLEIGFTRFRLGALYAPEKARLGNLQPYVGAEGQFYVINNNVKNEAGTRKQEGQDYSFAPLIGVEYSFGHFAVGLEFMYNLGSYTQDLAGGDDYKVSIDGPEVCLTIGYKF